MTSFWTTGSLPPAKQPALSAHYIPPASAFGRKNVSFIETGTDTEASEVAKLELRTRIGPLPSCHQAVSDGLPGQCEIDQDFDARAHRGRRNSWDDERRDLLCLACLFGRDPMPPLSTMPGWGNQRGFVWAFFGEDERSILADSVERG